MNRLSTLKHLLPFCRPYRGRFLLAFMFLCVAAAATLAVPFAFKNLIDLGFTPRMSGANTPTDNTSINVYFLSLFAIACVLAVFTAARFYMVSWLGERVTADLRRAVYGRMLLQSPAFFETTQTGEVLSRLTTDTTLVQTVVGSSVSMGLRNLFLFVGGLIMLIITAPNATLIIILIIALVMIPIALFGRRVRKLSRASQDRIADSSAVAGEILNAMPIVQAFTNEGYENKKFGNTTEAAFETAVSRTRARAWLTAIVIVIVFGGAIYGLWLGARAVSAGTMTPGQLAQSILYVALVAGSVGALAEVIGDIQRATGATERLLELYTAVPHISSPDQQTKIPQPSGGVGVEFREVLFHYPSRPMTPALDRLTLSVASGETVAIVGPSGRRQDYVVPTLTTLLRSTVR